MIKYIFHSFLISISFASSAQAKIEFSSRYLDTSTDCTCLEKNLEEGQDCTKFSCKEMAGYQIEISYNGSACDLGKLKVLKNSKELITLSEVPAKLEWRFAGQEPFAVIYRLKGQSKNCQDQGAGGSSKAALVVKGLEANSKISGQVALKKVNANLKAREIADQGFIAQQKK